MNKCLPLLVSGLVFTIVGIVHVIRLVQGWDVMIAGVSIPPSVSVVACVVAFVLALWMFVAGCKCKKGK